MSTPRSPTSRRAPTALVTGVATRSTPTGSNSGLPRCSASTASRTPNTDLSSPAHLVQRFFDYLTAPPLTRSESEAVRAWLTPELADLFFAQATPDQRHAYHAAMHDVGKRNAGLGVIGRSVASVLIGLGTPLSDRMTAYRDHAMIGARELAAVGAPGLAIDFALHHQGERPSTIDPAVWEMLMAADQPPKTPAMLRRRITSFNT